MKNLLLFMFMLISITTFAQGSSEPKSSWGGVSDRKGQWYTYWGYNRDFYGKSDIHYTGPGYDFKLLGARADDMNAPWDPNVYLNWKQMSVPQFNARVGYHVTDRFIISAGWDHMKYRLTPVQSLTINGFIDPTKYDPSVLGNSTGVFNNQTILYTTKFMDFHHSNGFNFVRVAAEYRTPLWISKKGKAGLFMWSSVSAGIILPWTDFTFYGQRWLNWLHVAGPGVSVSTGLRAEFGKHFFAQVAGQYGYAFMPNIILQDGGAPRAKQTIEFFERSWSIGTYFGGGKKKR
jgi:hypothetical protein